MGQNNSIVCELQTGGVGAAALYPGQTVAGLVHLNIPESIKLGKEGQSISLKFVGEEYARWGRSRRERRIISEPCFFLDADLPRRLKGQYTIPFQFKIPSERALPPTFRARFLTGEAYVNYFAEVSFVEKRSSLLSIVSKPLHTKTEVFIAPTFPANMRDLMAPACRSGMFKTYFLGLVKRGHISVDAHLDRTVYSSSEQACVRVSVTNKCHERVTKLTATLIKRVECEKMKFTTNMQTVEDLEFCIPPNGGRRETFLMLPLTVPASEVSVSGALIRCVYFIEVGVWRGTKCSPDTRQLIHIMPSGSERAMERQSVLPDPIPQPPQLDSYEPEPEFHPVRADQAEHASVQVPGEQRVAPPDVPAPPTAPPIAAEELRVSGEQPPIPPRPGKGVYPELPPPPAYFQDFDQLPPPPCYSEGTLECSGSDAGGAMPSAPPPDWEPEMKPAVVMA